MDSLKTSNNTVEDWIYEIKDLDSFLEQLFIVNEDSLNSSPLLGDYSE